MSFSVATVSSDPSLLAGTVGVTHTVEVPSSAIPAFEVCSSHFRLVISVEISQLELRKNKANNTARTERTSRPLNLENETKSPRPRLPNSCTPAPEALRPSSLKLHTRL